jgi:predicted NBD/HSP70 family sugar kinase
MIQPLVGWEKMPRLKRTRFINTSRVLRAIWMHRRVSRIQLARSLNLDKSTISIVVSELLKTGIIHETEEGEAGALGGRKPVFLTLNRSYGCVLGIEMRPESYTAVAVDMEGSIIYSKFELIQLSGTNFGEVFADVTQRVREELKRAGTPLLGIGIGVSGVVDSQRGIIKYSIPLQIEEALDFRETIAAAYDLPVFIENDANACAWGELAFHRDKKLRDFIFVLVEFRGARDGPRMVERTGVGMGIVIGGRVHYGHDFSAGEFRSVFRTPESRGQFSLLPDEAFRLEQDPAVLGRFFRELSKNIAMLVNTLNLDHVFLGGTIERYEREVQPVLAEEIRFNWPYPQSDLRCDIRFSSQGEKAVAYGAAGVVLNRLFADTDIVESISRVVPGLQASLAAIPGEAP